MQNPGKIPEAGVFPPFCVWEVQDGNAKAGNNRFREAINVTSFWPHSASICMIFADGTQEANEELFCLLTEGVVDTIQRHERMVVFQNLRQKMMCPIMLSANSPSCWRRL